MCMYLVEDTDFLCERTGAKDVVPLLSVLWICALFSQVYVQFLTRESGVVKNRRTAR